MNSVSYYNINDNDNVNVNVNKNYFMEKLEGSI